MLDCFGSNAALSAMLSASITNILTFLVSRPLYLKFVIWLMPRLARWSTFRHIYVTVDF